LSKLIHRDRPVTCQRIACIDSSRNTLMQGVNNLHVLQSTMSSSSSVESALATYDPQVRQYVFN
jgi:hypothetical protein